MEKEKTSNSENKPKNSDVERKGKRKRKIQTKGLRIILIKYSSEVAVNKFNSFKTSRIMFLIMNLLKQIPIVLNFLETHGGKKIIIFFFLHF